MDSKRFIIADNQELSRYAVAQIVRNYNLSVGVEAIGVSNASELRKELKQNDNAVVVIDIANFDLPRTEDLVILQGEHSKTSWIILAAEMTEFMVRRLSGWQCFSFVLKECRLEEIVSALRLAQTGERFICHQVMDILLTPQDKNQDTEQLTQTEIEVLRLTAQGRSVKEIASIRNSSTHTIISHKRNIFRKIGVNTSYEATMYAAKVGLVNLMEYYI